MHAVPAIVGRGTRIHEDTQKYYFTLVNFRKATNHFADKDFDGDPVQIYEPGPDDPVDPPAPPGGTTPDPEPGEVIVDPGLPPIDIEPDPATTIYVRGVSVSIVAERVEYLDHRGRLVTESLRDSPERSFVRSSTISLFPYPYGEQLRIVRRVKELMTVLSRPRNGRRRQCID